jgi:DtxR family Mn-dependent transcriptional regulator
MNVPARLSGRFRDRRGRRLRERVEDGLKHLHACEEHGRSATVESLAGALGVTTRQAADLARELHDRGLARTDAGFVLTLAGKRWARSIVRAHRLWERYLADELRVPTAALHRRADRKEHDLAREDIDRLAAELGYPELDPHGDPIPTGAGVLERHAAVPVTMLPERAAARIVHLEDEPEAVYERLSGQGLEPGQIVTVRRVLPTRIVIEVEGTMRELAPVDAASVFVVPAAAPSMERPRTLADLAVGESARIGMLRIGGAARRRLLDLGFTPGTAVECALASPFGEPTAYRIRGTLIALRPEQAARIELAPPEEVRA